MLVLKMRHRQVKMQIYIMSSLILLLFTFLSCSALPWAPEYANYGKTNYVYLSPDKFWNNGLEREPNCDELRAMWRFSMIKSRRTEITNEIPTYRDPFAYNVWESNGRSNLYQSGSLRSSGYRGSNKHVYGKIIHSVPPEKYSEKLRVSGRSFDDMAKYLTADKAMTPRRKNAEAFRLPNGQVSFRKIPVLSDSFARLKAVVRAQRAKDMQNQHLSEGSYVNGMPKESSQGIVHNNPPYDYFYFGNNSFSGKRGTVSKSLHFITNPSSFIYGPSKNNDQFLTENYVTDYQYKYRPQYNPQNMKLSVAPIPSRY